MFGNTLTTDNEEIFQYLFDRPNEPLFIPKGDKQVSFRLPENYVVDRFRPLIRPQPAYAFAAATAPNENEILIEALDPLPDFSVPMQLGRDEVFSLFIPRHSELASALIKILIELANPKQLISALAYCRDRLNPYLFNYAMCVTLLHRADTRDIRLPSMASIFPEKYFPKSVLTRAQVESNIVPAEFREPIEIPLNFTASDLDIEHRVAYFREDIGVNLHHWHWHLVYPFDGPRDIVNKDRRGELFYYMHHQILARYNFERLCNKLHRVKRLLNLREPILEGYFPKLDTIVANRVWPSRASNTTLKDVHITASEDKVIDVHIDLDHMERLKDRLLHAIHTGRVVAADGKEILLTENEGIDILGNMVESSILSVNRNFYGNFHNMGHLLLAYCHDPDHRYLESLGIMGDETTAMRDPVFYRWHALVDDIYLEYKDTLPSYKVDQLEYLGVEVQSVKVSTAGSHPNKLKTYWQKSDLNLSHGMTFKDREPVYVRFTHLQHEPFTYNIIVENRGPARLGTVRIFLAPTYDERGEPFLFKDQRHLFIELDKFVYQLEPNTNTIVRSSQDSSVTIPFEQTFYKEKKEESEEVFNLCGCGWPDHMLIPRGSAKEYPCQLFVMVSNYENDKMDNLVVRRKQCKEAASYCGLRDSKYPDKRAMGYPFDRKPLSEVDTLKKFLTRNMAVQDISICFEDRVVENRNVASSRVMD